MKKEEDCKNAKSVKIVTGSTIKDNFKVDVYKSRVYVVFAKEKNLNAEYKEFFPDHELESTYLDGLVAQNGDSNNYLVMFDIDSFDEGDVAHEANHLLNLIYNHVGAKRDVNNSEPECYLLGYLVNRIYEIYRND